MTRTTHLSDGFRPEHFEVDGSLRDVCVLDAGVAGWERLLRAVRDAPWEYRLTVDGRSCEPSEHSPRQLVDEEDATLSIRVGRMWFDSHFFEVGEIEFSFDPSEIEGGEQFGSLERFMLWLANACGQRVVLTMEASSSHCGMPPLLETVS